MMSYLSNKSSGWRSHNRGSRRGKNKRIRLILLAIALFVLLGASGIFGPFSYFLNKVATPVWKTGNFIKNKTNDLGYLLQSKKRLLAENELLKERLNEYEIQLLLQSVILDENKQLKETLQRASDILADGEEFILAVILAKPNRSPYDTLVIDLGRNSDIQKGDYVFARGDILIGQVEEVFSRSSKVKLFSTPGEKVDIVISGEDIYTTLIGRGGGNFEMTLPRDVEIEEGTKVVLSGITPYLVATVGKINYDPRDTLQEILLTSPVNVQHLKFVQVLVSTTDNN